MEGAVGTSICESIALRTQRNILHKELEILQKCKPEVKDFNGGREARKNAFL